MYTYQDLIKVGQNDKNRGEFCERAVRLFMNTQEYKDAKAGEAYYAKHNVTIEKYQKYLYTISGRQVPDVFSSNYKLKTTFFRRLVTQQAQYVLGNGLILTNEENKKKLGKGFDFQLQLAAKKAMVGGRSFGFWNLDHLEVFGYADTPTQAGFCPLLNEENAELDAGIRYWFKHIDGKKIFKCTLYEPDGYTGFTRVADEDIEATEPKRAYKVVKKYTEVGGTHDVIGENYGKIPIIQLFANDVHESELVGLRENVDCYDFIKSGLANDIDDLSGFYWILRNNGGMDDVDLAQFIHRMKTVRAAVVEDVDEISTNTPQIPTEARMAMLELLRKDIYEDFQALDVNTLSASAKTTQEIKAAYQAQDNKCADFEYYMLEFVDKILELAGINDEPSFIWNRMFNMPETTNMVLSTANYLSEECIIKHLPFLTPEEMDAEIEKLNEKMLDQFNSEEDEEYEDEELEEDEEEEEEPEPMDDLEDDDEVTAELDSILKRLGEL